MILKYNKNILKNVTLEPKPKENKCIFNKDCID